MGSRQVIGVCRSFAGRIARALRTDRRASMAILAAATLPALIGGAALVVDLAHAYSQRASLQQVADSAAIAGALAYAATAQVSAVTATVQDVVTANGWPASVIESSGNEYLAQSPQNSQNAAVQVSLVANAPLWFGALAFGAATIPTGVSSLAELASRQFCMLSLTTLIVNGTLNAGTCGVAADALGSNSVLVNSGGSITASAVSAAGSITNNGTITATKITGHTIADPYAADQSLASAGFTGCQNYNNQTSLSPGCYSNVNVNSGVTLTLQAGTFFFTGLNVNSGGSLVGTGGVTVVTQNNFSPSGNITITAPTTGNWAGMALYLAGGMNVNSGVTYTINGAIYSPTTALNLNSATWNANACTFVVAESITLNGGANFSLPHTGCSSYDFPSPVISIASLTR